MTKTIDKRNDGSEMTWRVEDDRVVDERGNSQVIFGGNVDAALERLKTLSRCSDCYDCFRCSDCSHCSDCYDCSDCSDERGELAVPSIEDIHKRVYEAASQPGALSMKDWHTCDTTHCRAGWVVHLAGDKSYELEKQTSPLFAAMQIYKASGYRISPVRFFDSNEDAMADMKRLAEQGD